MYSYSLISLMNASESKLQQQPSTPWTAFMLIADFNTWRRKKVIFWSSSRTSTLPPFPQFNIFKANNKSDDFIVWFLMISLSILLPQYLFWRGGVRSFMFLCSVNLQASGLRSLFGRYPVQILARIPTVCTGISYFPVLRRKIKGQYLKPL